MVPTIHIKEETRVDLLKILSKIQKTSTKKITYDDVVQYLLKKENRNIDKRRELTGKYAGILSGSNAHELLRECRRNR